MIYVAIWCYKATMSLQVNITQPNITQYCVQQCNDILNLNLKNINGTLNSEKTLNSPKTPNSLPSKQNCEVTIVYILEKIEQVIVDL